MKVIEGVSKMWALASVVGLSTISFISGAAGLFGVFTTLIVVIWMLSGDFLTGGGTNNLFPPLAKLKSELTSKAISEGRMSSALVVFLISVILSALFNVIMLAFSDWRTLVNRELVELTIYVLFILPAFLVICRSLHKRFNEALSDAERSAEEGPFENGATGDHMIDGMHKALIALGIGFNILKNHLILPLSRFGLPVFAFVLGWGSEPQWEFLDLLRSVRIV